MEAFLRCALMVAGLVAISGSTFTACTSDTSNTTRFQLPPACASDTMGRGPGGWNTTGRAPREWECGLLAPYGRYVKAADGGTILYVEVPKAASTTMKAWLRPTLVPRHSRPFDGAPPQRSRSFVVVSSHTRPGWSRHVAHAIDHMPVVTCRLHHPPTPPLRCGSPSSGCSPGTARS